MKTNQACNLINYAEWGVWNAVPRGGYREWSIADGRRASRPRGSLYLMGIGKHRALFGYGWDYYLKLWKNALLLWISRMLYVKKGGGPEHVLFWQSAEWSSGLEWAGEQFSWQACLFKFGCPTIMNWKEPESSHSVPMHVVIGRIDAFSNQPSHPTFSVVEIPFIIIIGAIERRGEQ